MRKIILEEWMSLDGHVADRNGSLDFFTALTPEQNRFSDLDQLKFLETVDTVLLGRKTYELFVGFWPNATSEQEIIADKLNEVKKVVFSNSLKKAPWGKWPEAEIMSGEVISAVRQLKSRPGKNIVIWGSISLAQALMEDSMIDEYHIQLCPVLTGGGRRLFTESIERKNLKLVESRQYETGVVFLNYIPG